MGSQQTKIDTKSVPLNQITSNAPSQQLPYHPPFRKFKSQYQKDTGKALQTYIMLQQPYSDSFQLHQPIYKDLQDAFNQKTKDYVIEYALIDDLYYDRFAYLVKKDPKIERTICLRAFNQFDSHLYASLICQVHSNQQIAKLDSQNLQKLQEHYIIQTNLQEDSLPNTQVLEFEPAVTNLDQIIQYRRQNKAPWSVRQFDNLIHDTISGLYTLHSHGISHNDIRPCNVYYSLEKNCYMLGSFSNAMILTNSNNTKQQNQRNSFDMRSSFMKVRTSKAFEAPELSESKAYDLFQTDIYSLGMTLLCAFYLQKPVSRQGTAPYNRKFEDSYKAMKIIRKMIKPEAKDRAKIQQLYQMVRESHNFKDQVKGEKMSNLIESLRYKSRPKQRKLAKTKIAFSQAYKRLGIWDQWKDQLAEALEIEESQLDEPNKAERLKQLAKADWERGQLQSASQYAKKASKIYRNIGYNALQEGSFDASISNFSKAVGTQKYMEVQYDYDMAKNLQGLAMAHAEKGEYQIAKPLIEKALQVVQKTRGRDSLQYSQLNISYAKLQTDFQEFESSSKILQQTLQLAHRKSQINPTVGAKIKAQVLHELGRNFMHQSNYHPQVKEDRIAKSQQCLHQAMRINESLDFDNHLQIAENLQSIGELQFRLGRFHDAKSNFTKAASMREHYHTKIDLSSNPINKERAQLLCHLAGCETSIGLHDKSIENYNKAIDMYRSIYGTDHNRYSAMAIGNLGRVYHNVGQDAKAKDCVRCAKNILADVLGEDDPDYQFFEMAERKLNAQQ